MACTTLFSDRSVGSSLNPILRVGIASLSMRDVQYLLLYPSLEESFPTRSGNVHLQPQVFFFAVSDAEAFHNSIGDEDERIYRI